MLQHLHNQHLVEIVLIDLYIFLMTIIIAAMQDLLLSFESSKTGWKTYESLEGCHPQSVTFDHRNSNRVYCGTFGDGLWKSHDAGHSWDRIAKDSISSNGKHQLV